MPLRIASTWKNQPSLPANYVSLADLQQRWLNQQKQKKEKEGARQKQQQPMRENEELQQKQQQQHQRKTEKKEPQKSSLEKKVNPKPQFQEPRNPNFKPRGQFHRNNRHRKGPKESKIEGTVIVGVEIDGQNHPVDDLRVKDENTMNKKSEKKVPCVEIALGEEMDGRDCPVKDLRVNDEKTMEKSKKKVPKSEPSEIEATVEEKVKSDGQDQIGGEEKLKDEKKRKWKKKKKNKEEQISVPEKQNPAMNGELGNDQTAEIGQRFEKLSVNRREWRGNGRWTAGIEGSRRANQSYGRVNRVMERKWRDNGLIWVKKGEVADHTVV